MIMAVQAQRECRNIYFTPLVHSMYALHLRRWLRIFPREPCSMVKRAILAEAELATCGPRRPRSRARDALRLQSRAAAARGLQRRFGAPPRRHESSSSTAEFGRPPRSFLLLRFDDLVLQPLLALQQLTTFMRVAPLASNFKVEVGPLAIVSIAIASIAIASIAIASIAIVSIATANFKVEVGRHGQSALTCSSPCGRPPLQKTGRLRRAAPLRERHLPCVGAIRGSAAVPVCLPATLPPPHRLWSSRWAVPTTRLASGCSGQARSRRRRWRCCRATSGRTTTRSMRCSRTVSSGERHRLPCPLPTPRKAIRTQTGRTTSACLHVLVPSVFIHSPFILIPKYTGDEKEAQSQ